MKIILFISLFLISLSSSAQISIAASGASSQQIKVAAVSVPTPAASWNFDNDIDDDINTYAEADGAAVGTLAYDAGDKVEGTHSLDLDGSTMAVTINTSGLTTDFWHNAKTGVTYAVWAKFDTDSQLMNLWDEGGNGKGCNGQRTAADNFEVSIRASTGNEYVLSVAYPTDNDWHHIAFVFNGTLQFAYLYLDGVEVDSQDMSATSENDFESHNDDGAIGHVDGTISSNDGTDGNLKMDGHIDDFRYWESALTAEQIEAVYDENAP